MWRHPSAAVSFLFCLMLRAAIPLCAQESLEDQVSGLRTSLDQAAAAYSAMASDEDQESRSRFVRLTHSVEQAVPPLRARSGELETADRRAFEADLDSVEAERQFLKEIMAREGNLEWDDPAERRKSALETRAWLERAFSAESPAPVPRARLAQLARALAPALERITRRINIILAEPGSAPGAGPATVTAAVVAVPTALPPPPPPSAAPSAADLGARFDGGGGGVDDLPAPPAPPPEASSVAPLERLVQEGAPPADATAVRTQLQEFMSGGVDGLSDQSAARLIEVVTRLRETHGDQPLIRNQLDRIDDRLAERLDERHRSGERADTATERAVRLAGLAAMTEALPHLAETARGQLVDLALDQSLDQAAETGLAALKHLPEEQQAEMRRRLEEAAAETDEGLKRSKLSLAVSHLRQQLAGVSELAPARDLLDRLEEIKRGKDEKTTALQERLSTPEGLESLTRVARAMTLGDVAGLSEQELAIMAELDGIGREAGEATAAVTAELQRFAEAHPEYAAFVSAMDSADQARWAYAASGRAPDNFQFSMRTPQGAVRVKTVTRDWDSSSIERRNGPSVPLQVQEYLDGRTPGQDRYSRRGYEVRTGDMLRFQSFDGRLVVVTDKEGTSRYYLDGAFAGSTASAEGSRQTTITSAVEGSPDLFTIEKGNHIARLSEPWNQEPAGFLNLAGLEKLEGDERRQALRSRAEQLARYFPGSGRVRERISESLETMLVHELGSDFTGARLTFGHSDRGGPNHRGLVTLVVDHGGAQRVYSLSIPFTTNLELPYNAPLSGLVLAGPEGQLMPAGSVEYSGRTYRHLLDAYRDREAYQSERPNLTAAERERRARFRAYDIYRRVSDAFADVKDAGKDLTTIQSGYQMEAHSYELGSDGKFTSTGKQQVGRFVVDAERQTLLRLAMVAPESVLQTGADVVGGVAGLGVAYSGLGLLAGETFREQVSNDAISRLMNSPALRHYVGRDGMSWYYERLTPEAREVYERRAAVAGNAGQGLEEFIKVKTGGQRVLELAARYNQQAARTGSTLDGALAMSLQALAFTSDFGEGFLGSMGIGGGIRGLLRVSQTAAKTLGGGLEAYDKIDTIAGAAEIPDLLANAKLDDPKSIHALLLGLAGLEGARDFRFRPGGGGGPERGTGPDRPDVVEPVPGQDAPPDLARRQAPPAPAVPEPSGPSDPFGSPPGAPGGRLREGRPFGDGLTGRPLLDAIHGKALMAHSLLTNVIASDPALLDHIRGVEKLKGMPLRIRIEAPPGVEIPPDLAHLFIAHGRMSPGHFAAHYPDSNQIVLSYRTLELPTMRIPEILAHETQHAYDRAAAGDGAVDTAHRGSVQTEVRGHGIMAVLRQAMERRAQSINAKAAAEYDGEGPPPTIDPSAHIDGTRPDANHPTADILAEMDNVVDIYRRGGRQGLEAYIRRKHPNNYDARAAAERIRQGLSALWKVSQGQPLTPQDRAVLASNPSGQALLARDLSSPEVRAAAAARVRDGAGLLNALQIEARDTLAAPGQPQRLTSDSQGDPTAPGTSDAEIIRRMVAAHNEGARVLGSINDEGVRNQKYGDCQIHSLYNLPELSPLRAVGFEAFSRRVAEILEIPLSQVRENGMTHFQTWQVLSTFGLKPRDSFSKASSEDILLGRLAPRVAGGETQAGPSGLLASFDDNHAVVILGAYETPQGWRYVVANSGSSADWSENGRRQLAEYTFEQLQGRNFKTMMIEPSRLTPQELIQNAGLGGPAPARSPAPSPAPSTGRPPARAPDAASVGDRARAMARSLLPTGLLDRLGLGEPAPAGPTAQTRLRGEGPRPEAPELTQELAPLTQQRAAIEGQIAELQERIAAGRGDAPRPAYHNPGSHGSVDGAPTRSNAGGMTTPLPADAERVFADTIPDPASLQPGRVPTWWGRNARGEYYRFQGDAKGSSRVHWNGSNGQTGGARAFQDREIPNEVKRHFEARDRLAARREALRAKQGEIDARRTEFASRSFPTPKELKDAGVTREEFDAFIRGQGGNPDDFRGEPALAREYLGELLQGRSPPPAPAPPGRTSP